MGSKEYEGSFPQAPFSEMATKWDCSCKVCFQHSIQSDSPKNRCWLLLLLQTLRFTDCETGACCSHCSLLDLMRIGSHHSFYNPSNHNTQWANLRLEKVICSLTNDLIRQDKSKKKKFTDLTGPEIKLHFYCNNLNFIKDSSHLRKSTPHKTSLGLI